MKQPDPGTGTTDSAEKKTQQGAKVMQLVIEQHLKKLVVCAPTVKHIFVRPGVLVTKIVRQAPLPLPNTDGNVIMSWFTVTPGGRSRMLRNWIGSGELFVTQNRHW